MDWVEVAELLCLWIALSAAATWAIGEAISRLRRKREPEQLDLFNQSVIEHGPDRALEQIWACRRFGMCRTQVTCNDNGYCAARGRP